MSEAVIYMIGVLLICFTITTFFLSRVQTDVYPENYDFKLDPFWPIISVMAVGSIVAFAFFPTYYDMVKDYGYMDFILPIFFAVLIYFCTLIDIGLLTNIVILIASFIMTFLQPDDFLLFGEQLTPLENRLAVVAILFTITKGMSLLNGLCAIGSMQFMVVMIVAVLLSYFKILPQLSGAIAMAYGGAMLAFSFFSWPPEKLIISDGAFSAFGFIMACFMLYCSVEYSEASMFIAISFLVMEVGVALYNRFIMHRHEEDWFMHTSYFQASAFGELEVPIVHGVLKIFIIDACIAMVQMAAQERLALPIFALALNFWFMSILSGDTKPEELLSFTNWGKKAIKGALKKTKKKKDE